VSQVRVKVCGLTSVKDAELALDAGVDAIGLVFYEPSPRCVDIETAAAIVRRVGPFVTTVGLFVDASVEQVKQVCACVPLQLLQFHGHESPAYCEQFQRPYLKALRMKPELDVITEIARYSSAQGILLDAYRKGVPGGTGESFDWSRVPRTNSLSEKQSNYPPNMQAIILAGGLTSENVAEAVVTTGVYGVDVSGGIESRPGCKDRIKIQAFVAAAQRVSGG